jgi:hypothetical protein
VLTSPAAGTTLAGQTCAAAAATDDNKVVRVRFSLDGRGIVDDATAPYASCFSTAALAAGPHTLTASTYDNGGRRAASSVTVYAGATADLLPPRGPRPPAVVVTAPFGATSFGSYLCPVASATDDARVVGVQFLLDGAPLVADEESPYGTCLPTENIAPGPHTLTAQAEDGAGGLASSSVNVTKTG